MNSYLSLSHQLITILNDSEGVQLFYQFLSSSFSCGHLLDFWFACKGFRSIVDGDDQLKLLQVAKAIYRTYIKTDASLSVPVSSSTKREIRSTLTAFSNSSHGKTAGDKCSPVLRSLFDLAQTDIQNLLSRRYLLEFLQSDSFRTSHKSSNILESDSCFSGKMQHHSFIEKADDVHVNLSNNVNLQQIRTLCGSADGTSSQAVDLNLTLPAVDRSSCEIGFIAPMVQPKVLTGGTVSSDKSRRTTVESDNALEMVTASELIAYINPSGNGANDSISPLSAPPKPLTAAPEITTRKPGINLAEIDPSAFAQTLSHRLEKVKESRGKMERLLSRIPAIDPEEVGGENLELASIHADVNQPPSPPLPTRCTRLSSASRCVPSVASGDLYKKLSNLRPPSVSSKVNVPSADDAQVILEDHCSRIWTDERRGQPLNVCRKNGRRSDVYSISSFDSGVGGGGGGVNSSDSESYVSRGGHFHQSHHHHQQYRWNYAIPQPPPPPPPPPPMCSFCRRTPSMSSTPGTHRKEVVSTGSSYRWGVQYQRIQYNSNHNHHGDVGGSGASRTMRSRSLTSDSPSVIDSGLSSTYDHLPPARRSRHDDPKVTQEQLMEGATPTLGGRPTPLSGGGGVDNDRVHHLIDDYDHVRSATPASLAATPGFSKLGCLPASTRFEKPKQPQPMEAPVPVSTNNTLYSENMIPTATVSVTPLPSHQPQPQLRSSTTSQTFSLVVGYYLCDDPVPYRTVWTGPFVSEAVTTEDVTKTAPSITLAQFKQLVAKKGVYRYFFKTASNDFGTGCVHEEVGDDNALLPLWDGKVIARVERTD